MISAAEGVKFTPSGSTGGALTVTETVAVRTMLPCWAVTVIVSLPTLLAVRVNLFVPLIRSTCTAPVLLPALSCAATGDGVSGSKSSGSYSRSAVMVAEPPPSVSVTDPGVAETLTSSPGAANAAGMAVRISITASATDSPLRKRRRTGWVRIEFVILSLLKTLIGPVRGCVRTPQSA